MFHAAGLLSKPVQTMTSNKLRVVRVFISSTFVDFQEERRLLVEPPQTQPSLFALEHQRHGTNPGNSVIGPIAEQCHSPHQM